MLSNLNTLFRHSVNWRKEGQSQSLRKYLSENWTGQRSDEAFSILRRWGLSGRQDSLKPAFYEWCDLFEADTDEFWLRLGDLVMKEDRVFAMVHRELLVKPFSIDEIVQLTNPVTADVCLSWGRLMELLFELYEDPGRYFAVLSARPSPRESRDVLLTCYRRMRGHAVDARVEYVRIPALINRAAFKTKARERFMKEELLSWAEERPFLVEFAPAPRVSRKRKGDKAVDFRDSLYYYVRLREDKHGRVP